MREDLGDGYADTRCAAYPDVPDSADFVLYWWHKAAELTRTGSARRFGLFTTNSLRQTFAHRIVQHHLEGKATTRGSSNSDTSLSGINTSACGINTSPSGNDPLLSGINTSACGINPLLSDNDPLLSGINPSACGINTLLSGNDPLPSGKAQKRPPTGQTGPKSAEKTLPAPAFGPPLRHSPPSCLRRRHLTAAFSTTRRLRFLFSSLLLGG